MREGDRGCEADHKHAALAEELKSNQEDSPLVIFSESVHQEAQEGALLFFDLDLSAESLDFFLSILLKLVDKVDL